MPKLIFRGRALPEYANISAPIVDTGWRHDVGLDGHFVVVIRDARVTIDCDMNRLEAPHDFHLIFTEADDLARTTLSLAAFQMGGGLDLWLDTVEIDGGPPAELRRCDLSLRAISTEAQSASDVAFIMEIAKQSLTLRMALRHLNEALIAPRRANVRSAQAVEGLQSLFLPPGNDDKKLGWLLLREHLNISEAYLKVVTSPSAKPRHGNYIELRGVNTTDVTHRAWHVMNRYIAFRKGGGSTPLPPERYPLLDE